MLAIITKMTLTQVSTWFANARRRLKKENKMQWSPRNRTDNDDDDKSTSDDDADAGNGNGKNDDVTAGNGTETRMTIGAKDSDDDVVVDNVGMFILGRFFTELYCVNGVGAQAACIKYCSLWRRDTNNVQNRMFGFP